MLYQYMHDTLGSDCQFSLTSCCVRTVVYYVVFLLFGFQIYYSRPRHADLKQHHTNDFLTSSTHEHEYTVFDRDVAMG